MPPIHSQSNFYNCFQRGKWRGKDSHKCYSVSFSQNIGMKATKFPSFVCSVRIIEPVITSNYLNIFLNFFMALLCVCEGAGDDAKVKI